MTAAAERKPWWSRVRPFLGLPLFGFALWILHHQLRDYHYRDVVADFRRLGDWRIAIALALTGLSYTTLTGYDWLGLRFIGQRLPYRRIALASFVAYVFSHNVGLSFLGGSAVRFRLYSSWGLSAGQIGAVLVFNVLTFWLGFLVLLGVALAAAPPPLPPTIQLPAASTDLLSALCLALLALYLALVAVRKTPLEGWGWEVRLPSPGWTITQMLLSAADWVLAASVLYVLLPPLPHLSVLSFIGIYLLAQVVGIASAVPAGLGVFESVVLVILHPFAPGPTILGSLLAYRVIYYFVPLVVGVALLAVHEARERRAGLARVGQLVSQWIPGIVPQALSLSTFVGGVILLVSGATPTGHGRFGWLRDLLPLPVMEISHFVGSVAGVGLLILARGLQLRLDAAYLLTAALLGAGVAASVVKGLRYEELLVLSVMLTALLPCRRHFYRRASLLDEPLTGPWIFAILLALIGTGWLMVLSSKHVEYSKDLWWQFEAEAHVPRALRAGVGGLLALAAYGAARLLRPARPDPQPPGPEELAVARALVAASPAAIAHLALLGDKRFLFNESRTACLMYNIERRSWVAMADPVGPEKECRELVWEFHELSDRHAGWTVFYEIGEEHLTWYLDLGLTLLKLGEEARVHLPTFTLEGGARKAIRQAHHRLDRDGCRFEIVPAEGVRDLLADLQTVSDSWLAEKGTREKGFSLGSFAPDYLTQLPVAVVRQGDRIIAFANLWRGAQQSELSVDLMRYVADAPHGVMDYVFVELMLWGQAQGYQYFNLGMAPLSGLEDRALAPLWNRLGAFVFRHGEDFYNFRGLRQYKEKFGPEWTPRYLACPGGIALPVILANVAALVSGGLRGVVAK